MCNPPPLDSAATVVPWQEGCDAYATVSAATDNRRVRLEIPVVARADTNADATEYPYPSSRLKSGGADRQSVHIGCVRRYDAPPSAGGAPWHRQCDPTSPDPCSPPITSPTPCMTPCLP